MVHMGGIQQHPRRVRLVVGVSKRLFVHRMSCGTACLRTTELRKMLTVIQLIDYEMIVFLVELSFQTSNNLHSRRNKYVILSALVLIYEPPIT